MGTAFQELEAGAAGSGTVTLLIRLTRQVGNSRTFPPPTGYPAWSEDAATEWVSSLFADRGPTFLFTCFVQATDDSSLERLLLTTITNALIDEAKATEAGKMRRRLGTLLTADDRFEPAPRAYAGESAWRHQRVDDRPWDGDLEELVAHLHVADVAPILALNRGGRTPRAIRESLTDASATALLRTNAAVRAQLLARAILIRFELSDPQVVALLADTDELVDDDAATVAVEAEDLFERLDEQGRRVVALLGDEKAIRDAFGDDAAAASDAVIFILQARLGQSPIRDLIFRRIQELCVDESLAITSSGQGMHSSDRN
ncbi:hypothetical protein QP735_06930 [Curtobacterium citreum]|uniref:hypothetical protein n=1 Tax=Curtobacterium citreum TaxID=2036 RepID=UPI00254E156B|nr:hypothetical protein [Curtobacterium citreum]MDK8172263.1 hypothetical protein [Curtobacterium citreum]